MIPKNLYKVIGQVYEERFKSLIKSDDLFITCYDHFIGLFGVKKVAESKIS